MSSKLEAQLPLLRVLKDANPALRKAIILHSTPELIEALGEISFNYLKGNINCTKSHYQDLKSYKKCLRTLVNGCLKKRCSKEKHKNYRIKERRVLSRQKGGFWQVLLGPVISELSEYFLRQALQG